MKQNKEEIYVPEFSKNVDEMWTKTGFYPDGCINTIKELPYFVRKPFFKYNILWFYLVIASCTATATATVAPTIGLFPSAN